MLLLQAVTAVISPTEEETSIKVASGIALEGQVLFPRVLYVLQIQTGPFAVTFLR